MAKPEPLKGRKLHDIKEITLLPPGQLRAEVRDNTIHRLNALVPKALEGLEKTMNNNAPR